VSERKDFKHYLRGLLLLEKPKKTDDHIESGIANALVSNNDGLEDRLRILALHGESRSKRIFSNIFYSIVMVALFFASYMFTILPAFWESPYVSLTPENFMEACREGEDVLRAEENFLIDNGDGTFSLYIEGQFVKYTDATNENIHWLPIRERNND
jgi:hypothetical protein